MNIEKIVIAFLEANKSEGWQVFGDMPKDRPASFILVDRTGGPRENVVQDRAEILIEVYQKDSRESASDEANRIADIMPQLNAIDDIMRAEINSVIKLDDTINQYSRYQVYCDVYYRRGESTADVEIPELPSGEPILAASELLDLTDKIALPGGAYISGVANASLYWTKNGQYIDGNLLIVIPPEADWGEPLEGVGHMFGIKGEDLPFAPRQMGNETIGEIPQVMGFALMNIQDSLEVQDPTLIDRHGLGGVITSMGGLIGNTKPGITFFKTKDGNGSLYNMPLNGIEGINYVGRFMTVYAKVHYEIE